MTTDQYLVTLQRHYRNARIPGSILKNSICDYTLYLF